MMKNGILKHSYEFGAVNRMTRAADDMGNMAEYDYNGLGHRVGMRQGRTDAAGLNGIPDFREDGPLPDVPKIWEKETEYILDLTKGYHNLLQKEENGNIQSYIWDREPLFMQEDEEFYSYLNDMQGSVMRLSDHSGESAASYVYDEFGADLLGNQGQFQPFGYTGYQRDGIAGTYYAQAREYDVKAGRFTSEDVIKGYAAYPETLNAYGYCWGNPLKYVDRDGAFPVKSFMDTAGNVLDEVKGAASDAIEWAQSVWTQDIVGEDIVYVSDGDEEKSFEISTHTGGNVIVIKKDRQWNFLGWSVNGKVKFGDTGASISAKLSGTGIDPRKWKFNESLKYKDKKTDITYGFGKYVDIKGQGYTISASGTIENIPEGALDDIPVKTIDDISWSMSYNGEITNWKNMLEAVVTAGAIVGLIAFLVWLAGNDTTGVGVLDDAAIPGVLAALKSLVENFGQCLPQILNNTACGLE